MWPGAHSVLWAGPIKAGWVVAEGLRCGIPCVLEEEKEGEEEEEEEEETQRHRDTETQRLRDTETQRFRDTETQTQRRRDTETQACSHLGARKVAQGPRKDPRQPQRALSGVF